MLSQPCKYLRQRRAGLGNDLGICALAVSVCGFREATERRELSARMSFRCSVDERILCSSALMSTPWVASFFLVEPLLCPFCFGLFLSGIPGIALLPFSLCGHHSFAAYIWSSSEAQNHYSTLFQEKLNFSRASRQILACAFQILYDTAIPLAKMFI
jgi:hypothetical protein